MSTENTDQARRPKRKRGDGEGSIDEVRDGLWRGRMMVGYKADGKADRRVVYGKTRAEVQRKLRDLKRKAEEGLLSDAAVGRDTVAIYIARWLEVVKTTIRPSTWERYADLLRLHVVPTLGKYKLTDLRPDVLQRLYAAKLAAGLAPRTVHHIHAVLHAAFEQAMRWGYVSRNVIDVVAPPKVPRVELHPPTPDELARVLDSAESANDRLRALWTIAVYTGCRQGELLALRWSDVDLDAGTLTVQRTLLRTVAGAPVFGEPKTSRSRRTITLPPSAVAALQRHHHRQEEETAALGPDYSTYRLVFCTHIGTALGARNVVRSFKTALGRAGLPATVRFHDLRHAAATMMLRAHVPLKVASARLGHSTVGITADLYTHAVPELEVDAAAKLELMIRGTRVTHESPDEQDSDGE